MHADLYAHNTLIDEEGNTLFGDFGAATIYKGMEPETASALERLEVSAFGCLLEDLLMHVASKEKNSEIISRLFDLQKACVQLEVLERPNFKTVFDTIEDLREMISE